MEAREIDDAEVGRRTPLELIGGLAPCSLLGHDAADRAGIDGDPAGRNANEALAAALTAAGCPNRVLHYRTAAM